MLTSLFSYTLISNALTLRKDKSILFSIIIIISLVLTIFLAFNNLFCFNNILGFNKFLDFNNLFFVCLYVKLILLLIYLLIGLVFVVYNYCYNNFFLLCYLLSTNVILALLLFNLFFNITCFMINLSILDSSMLPFYLLTENGNKHNPMSIHNLLNPSTPTSDGGGGGGSGGPPHQNIPVHPSSAGNSREDHNEEVTTYADTHENIGDKLERIVNNVLQERRDICEANPLNPSGKKSRISEQVAMPDLKLSKEDRTYIRQRVAREDFPSEFDTFKRTLLSKGSGGNVYSKSMGYSLINYFKNNP